MAVLFFNLELLMKTTGGDPSYTMEALKKLHSKERLPKSRLAKYKPIVGLGGGYSYLLNPAALFADKSTDILYKSQYVQLAARREYLDYKVYKSKYLDLSFFPDIEISIIKSNPLILITDNKIYFKYEETV